MISNLHVKNLGIIDDIDIEFDDNLNVITGETGAGKSLIIDALSLISGGRFSKEMIRKEEENLEIELNIFKYDIDELENKNVVVSRQININGKNICRINGKLVSVSQLKEYMEDILDLHMQNDNNKLLDKKNHIEFLDSYSNEIIELKEKYKQKYFDYLKVENELNSNLGDEKERKRTLDLYQYEINEIKEANLVETEEELEEKHILIKNSNKISEVVSYAKNSLEQNVLDSLENIIRNYGKISDLNQTYLNQLSSIESAYYELKEVSDSSSNILDDLELNEQEILEFEKRLDIINTLKRKYGNTINEIIEYKEQLEEKVQKILNMDKYLTDLNSKADLMKKELLDISGKLNLLRRKYCEELESEINNELLDMEMKNVVVKIDIDFDENKKLSDNGQDTVEFLIKTNVGQDFMPLIKIASGGELSRVMLAIKTVLSNSSGDGMLVLDEIDTGISGNAANKVAMKLSKLSKSTQILCVTHLPNIAAVADNNLFIYKEDDEKCSLTKVKTLNNEEKTEEIARISFGRINEVSLKYALELQRQKI